MIKVASLTSREYVLVCVYVFVFLWLCARCVLHSCGPRAVTTPTDTHDAHGSTRKTIRTHDPSGGATSC